MLGRKSCGVRFYQRVPCCHQHLRPKVVGFRSPWCKSVGKHRRIQRSMAGIELSRLSPTYPDQTNVWKVWHLEVSAFKVVTRLNQCDRQWFVPYKWMQNVSETDRSPVEFGTWFSCLYKGLFKNGYPNLSNDQWDESWWIIRFPWFPDVSSISWQFLWCLYMVFVHGVCTWCLYMVFVHGVCTCKVRVKSVNRWGHSVSKWLACGTEGLGLGQRSAAAMWCCGVRKRMGIWRSGSLACVFFRSKWFFAYFGLFKLMIFLDIYIYIIYIYMFKLGSKMESLVLKGANFDLQPFHPGNLVPKSEYLGIQSRYDA